VSAGEHLSVIFVTMLLAGAMPIAFFSAAFWFVSSYWCDKAELLKLSRRPVIYGNTLSDHVMNLLPFAAVSGSPMHMVTRLTRFDGDAASPYTPAVRQTTFQDPVSV
jgi:ABC-type uncharacterized transport system permease subunit